MDSRPTRAPSSAADDSTTDASSVSDNIPTYLVSTNATFLLSINLNALSKHQYKFYVETVPEPTGQKTRGDFN